MSSRKYILAVVTIFLLFGKSIMATSSGCTKDLSGNLVCPQTEGMTLPSNSNVFDTTNPTDLQFTKINSSGSSDIPYADPVDATKGLNSPSATMDNSGYSLMYGDTSQGVTNTGAVKPNYNNKECFDGDCFTEETDPCQDAYENAKTSCDAKSNSDIINASNMAGNLAKQVAGQSAVSACSGMGSMASAGSAAVASFKASCQSAANSCVSSCQSSSLGAKDFYITECNKKIKAADSSPELKSMLSNFQTQQNACNLLQKQLASSMNMACLSNPSAAGCPSASNCATNPTSIQCQCITNPTSCANLMNGTSSSDPSGVASAGLNGLNGAGGGLGVDDLGSGGGLFGMPDGLDPASIENKNSGSGLATAGGSSRGGGPNGGAPDGGSGGKKRGGAGGPNSDAVKIYGGTYSGGPGGFRGGPGGGYANGSAPNSKVRNLGPMAFKNQMPDFNKFRPGAFPNGKNPRGLASNGVCGAEIACNDGRMIFYRVKDNMRSQGSTLLNK